LERRIRIDLTMGDVEAAKGRLPGLVDTVKAIATLDRASWCSREDTLRAEIAFSERDWQAVSDALESATRGIASAGCRNDAIATENDLLRVLANGRAGHALDKGEIRSARVSALSLKFPPPEVVALAKELNAESRH
jgi:hypothetical protein